MTGLAILAYLVGMGFTGVAVMRDRMFKKDYFVNIFWVVFWPVYWVIYLTNVFLNRHQPGQ